jgi:hypothetical protein
LVTGKQVSLLQRQTKTTATTTTTTERVHETECAGDHTATSICNQITASLVVVVFFFFLGNDNHKCVQFASQMERAHSEAVVAV